MARPPDAVLQQLTPEQIRRNPDNPRLIFRQDELDRLLNSIMQVGIQVPVTVFRADTPTKYVLLDGERRWICARKLNLPHIPAIVYPKPSRLENILRMFNIHNVREQWDLLPTAYKLREVRDLIQAQQKREPTAQELATATGVSAATIRRAFELLRLPKKYLDRLMEELKKPKAEQRLSEDLFLEMTRSLRAIENYNPDVFRELPRSKFIDSFVRKYETGVIKNVVRFRDLSRIARAERAGVSKKSVVPVLTRLANDPDYSLEDAFQDSVGSAYEVRDLRSRLQSLTKRLASLRSRSTIAKELKAELIELRSAIDKLLAD